MEELMEMKNDLIIPQNNIFFLKERLLKRKITFLLIFLITVITTFLFIGKTII